MPHATRTARGATFATDTTHGDVCVFTLSTCMSSHLLQIKSGLDVQRRIRASTHARTLVHYSRVAETAACSSNQARSSLAYRSQLSLIVASFCSFPDHQRCLPRFDVSRTRSWFLFVYESYAQYNRSQFVDVPYAVYRSEHVPDVSGPRLSGMLTAGFASLLQQLRCSYGIAFHTIY
jgi:hypothetical protein